MGSCVSSTKRRIAAPPCDHFTLVPAIMIGRFAPASSSSAATTSLRSGAWRGARRNFGNQALSKSPGAISTSIGISRNAGPGMPEVAWRTASSMYSGMRAVS